MLFNTFEFVYFFLATVVVYFLLQHKYRWIFLLVVSYYFYFSWEPILVLLLFASTSIDYLCGIKIHESNHSTTRKAYLLLSIVVNLGLLIFFKYLGFFAETTMAIMQFFGIELPNSAQMTNSPREFMRILIPIGISFYTFQTLGYTIDVYRRNIVPERHFGIYALYVSFFPQLVSGPIERANHFLPQLRQKVTLDVTSIRIGLVLMAWGYFMKIVVADRLGIYVDIVFNDPAGYPGIPLIIGAYFFTFQIYFDFAAYSIIAIGAARVLGYKLTTNFNRPLFSKNAGEFWRRWHMSLMHWLREYVYRPLAMSRYINRYWALLVVFVVSGLWHGASWNFVIWGTMNGLFLIFEVRTRKLRGKLIDKVSHIVPEVFFRLAWWLFTFHFVVFSLILFRTQTISHAILYIRNLLRIRNLRISVLDDPFEMALCLLLIIFIQIVHYLKPDHRVYELVFKQKSLLRWSLYLVFIFVMVFFGISSKNAFIYFQF